MKADTLIADKAFDADEQVLEPKGWQVIPPRSIASPHDPSLPRQAPGYTDSELLRREVPLMQSTYVFCLSALPPPTVRRRDLPVLAETHPSVADLRHIQNRAPGSTVLGHLHPARD
jgi:hypothetical protein